MRFGLSAVAGTLVLTIAMPTFAGKPGTGAGGGTSRDIAITATVADYQNGSRLYESSDGAGAYTGSIQPAADNLSSDIVVYAGLYGGKRRLARFSFEEPVAWSGTNWQPFAPSTNETVKGHFVLKCAARGVDVRTMALGQVAYCALMGEFDFGAGSYRIASNALNPNNAPDGGGEDASIQCSAVDATGCKAWSISPAGAATLTDGVAKSKSMLFDRNTNGFLGYYFMSFLINVQR